MQEKFLPIGTVVMLKEAKKSIMITGYLVTPNNNESIVYDYCGCLFPEGIISSEQTLVFNHDQIGIIMYKGFENDEQRNLNNLLKDTQTPSPNNDAIIKNNNIDTNDYNVTNNVNI